MRTPAKSPRAGRAHCRIHANAADPGTLYGSIFYHLSKRTELYLAGDYMKLHGGYKVSSTFGSNNQFELTTGIRTRF